VLTGPDHLSAIATLSATVRSSFEAFWLGVRWGVGHSTGLLAVGLVLIFLTALDDEGADDDGNSADAAIDVPDSVSSFFESLVGIFMLLLGAYGVRRAWSRRPKSYGFIPDVDAGVSSFDVELHRQQSETENDEDSRLRHLDHHGSFHHHSGALSPTGENIGDPGQVIHSSGPSRCCSCYRAVAEKVSTGTMAIFAGIVHGMAGPGGVLGVIPAVQLHNWRLATLYLGCFCVSSTVTMGAFAALYGTLSTKLGGTGGGPENNGGDNDGNVTNARGAAQRQFWIECLSACLSIVVGITWLVLLSIGKLDDIFP